MCQAMIEYDQGNYNRAVELLYPLRYRVVDIGGSDAQVRSTEINNSKQVRQMKQNQVQTRLLLCTVEKSTALRLYFLWIPLIMLSYFHEHNRNPCCREIGERQRTLCIKAKAFQSVDILHGVRMWSTVHQCMNNESLMDGDGRYASYGLCLQKKNGPQGATVYIHTV